MKKQFDGNKEDSSAPRAFRGKEIYDMVKDIDVVLGKGALRSSPLHRCHARGEERM